MTREEHLEFAKQRALAYLPGDPAQAFISMLSDLRKHPELENHVGCRMGVGMMMIPGWIENPREVERWIIGFN